MTADLSGLLNQLKEKAEKATPGPWEITRRHYNDATEEHDDAFIAAAHPLVVVALVEVAAAADHLAPSVVYEAADRLDAALARLRQVLTDA